MSNRKKILVFTGAGVSAESGIKTFRDYDGLWENYKIEEVASTIGWHNDKELVLEFYNLRRKDCRNAEPNNAHKLIAELEKDFDVTIVTQNVDDLHERAGSTKVLHLHGELNKSRSEDDITKVYDCPGDINIGDKAEDGHQLRPHIVWFGEMLDQSLLQQAETACVEADYCIIVGTSMQVSPANQIPFLTRDTVDILYIDPSTADFKIPERRRANFEHIKQVASTGMEEASHKLYSLWKMKLL